MKEVFIGSSKEAFHQAEQIAALLAEVPGVKPLLWTEVFDVGDITFLAIEQAAKRVVGAVFLATPDDESVIRDRKVKIPRANVLFEYGYLAARLSRAAVALCRYSNTELPSDFAGLTVIPMGDFHADAALQAAARARLRTWATRLSAAPLLAADWGEEVEYPPAVARKRPRLSREEIEDALRRLPDWTLQERTSVAGSDGKRIGLARSYMFPKFEDAMHFMIAASRLFSQADHHPEWENVWVTVRVWLTSFDIGHRPSRKDVSLAEQLDRLYESYYASGTREGHPV